MDIACSIKGLGSGDERTLVEKFGAVSRVYRTLPKASQEVIMDITEQMGAGMAEYVAADLGQGTVDGAAYDRYCHMVAGLVGEGLSRLFVARGMESEDLLGQGERVWPFCADPKVQKHNLGLANSMGLFLQKCNIIRDYLEDYAMGGRFGRRPSGRSTPGRETLASSRGQRRTAQARGCPCRALPARSWESTWACRRSSASTSSWPTRWSSCPTASRIWST
eukprot:SRR837773.7348.p1 GENE.SRR837773.7348~~SRR837773.7348.p1  ORF type:complete len:232 (-),score=47.56 SRR837773.7348:238-900(-)